MPLYCFTCDRGHTTDDLHPMDQIPTFIECPKCHRHAVRDLTAQLEGNLQRPASYPPYYHYGLGMTVSSARQVDQECKKRGLMAIGLVRGA